MTTVGATVSKAALTLFLGLVMSAVAFSGDLSKYREFQLGSDVATIAKQAGVSAPQAKDIQRRPALIQELQWRPQSLGWSSKTEAVDDVVFSFYNGEMFRLAVKYDRYQTEGLTAEDLIEAISATYGTATEIAAPAKAAQGRYGDQDELLAQWQDAQYRFQLMRSSYGPGFSLIGILKRLETPVQAAILEATRLDVQEAPQRETARIATEEEAAKTKLEKARLANKPKFRP
jgi:hypothetical protein